MRTDKELLIKGLQRLALTAVLMFLAPVILWQAFKNEEHILFWPVLVVGILMGGYAVFLGFRGIMTIMDSMFGKKQS